MRKCTFCAEDIQDAAIVCTHCKREQTRQDSNTALEHKPPMLHVSAPVTSSRRTVGANSDAPPSEPQKRGQIIRFPVKPDVRAEIDLPKLRERACAGEADAQFRLGAMYYEGRV